MTRAKKDDSDNANAADGLRELPYRHFGWVRDLPDKRDLLYSVPLRRRAVLPEKVDNRPLLNPTIWDQGSLGSCVANSLGMLLWSIDKTEPFEPSRLFLYYNARLLEGTRRWDSGATIRNGIKAAVKYGICPESDWEYIISKFTDKPTPSAYVKAKQERIKQYQRIKQTPSIIQGCLAEGNFITFGFSVYNSIYDDSVSRTGIIPMPKRKDTMIGGHAVLMCGYDAKERVYIIRNSWGLWADKGYGYLPFQYVHNTNLCADLWTVTSVT